MSDQLSFDLPLGNEPIVQLWTPNEVYDRLDASNLAHFVEDRRVERKSAGVQPKALSEYLSMWANTQPHGGIVIVGIENDGTITGCKSLSAVHLNNLEALSPLCPDARWASKKVAAKNNKGEDDYLLVLRVDYRSDKVVEVTNGDAFIREGDRKLRISEALKRELQISKGEIHYELEDVTLSYPADFDTGEIDRFARAFFMNRRLQTPKSREEILVLAKLGRRRDGQFKPNLACALLFSNDPREVIPGARIRVIRYEGTFERFGSELNAVFSTFVDGNISKLLFEAKPVIASQLRSFQRFNATGRIETQQEYPEEAWFEAIVNAVAHRSYNLKNQNIFIKIFDDRFIVESPGGFVPPTTASTVYDAHNPRNPYLMEAMMRLELTFCGYEGTRRMRRAMQEASLPDPRFRQVEANSHQVHALLENNIASRKGDGLRVASVIDVRDFPDLTSEERTIVAYLKTSREINITNASLIISRSWPTASKVLASLVDKGFLELSTKRGRSRDPSKTYRLKLTE